MLLFFERLIFATTYSNIWNKGRRLWIAFVLWKIDICYNFFIACSPRCAVVNCFCSLKDWYLLQLKKFCKSRLYSCELLLFFERLIFATTTRAKRHSFIELWIAFVLWKIDICYNLFFEFLKDKSVVNCFCSLKDWYLLQLQRSILWRATSCELLLFFERLIFATTV